MKIKQIVRGIGVVAVTGGALAAGIYYTVIIAALDQASLLSPATE